MIGPTASGKSALAFEAARVLTDVEIVSLDSMQVYRGMDVGTAKPTPSERAVVPHHLLDVADPWEEWTVAQTQRAARAAVADIEARGKRALLVGGTGLYVQAVVDDLRLPGSDPEVRAEIEAGVARDGLPTAYDELRRLDAEAAERIAPGNQRRVVRALEVIRLTGRPFSSFGPGMGHYGPTVFSVDLVGVWLPRARLATRIAARLLEMWSPLVAEVRTLVEPGGRAPSRTAREAIGYREVAASLEGRLGDLDEAFDHALRRTRTLARRQRMWFRRDPRIRWLGIDGNPSALLAPLLATWAR